MVLPSLEYASHSIEAILQAFNVSPISGLAKTQVRQLQIKHGKNILQTNETEESIQSKIYEQVANPLIAMLGVSALISAALGEWSDAISITASVTIVVTGTFTFTLIIQPLATSVAHMTD